MTVYKTPDNKKIYRQADKRWARLPYPTLNYSFANNGCGCCAATHCIIERDKYKNYTPANVQPYMKQYATKGHGTEWRGITEALKHYGLKNVKSLNYMADLWPELKKGDRVGVLLFNNHKANVKGGCWTMGGHYVAFVGYKVVNNKHYLYMKDSGGRKHDGWYCYETTMRGCINKIWVGQLPDEIELPAKGYWTLGDRSAEIIKIQKFLKKKGYYNGKIGTKTGKIGQKTFKAIQAFQKANGLKADGVWGPKTNAKYEEVK